MRRKRIPVVSQGDQNLSTGDSTTIIATEKVKRTLHDSQPVPQPLGLEHYGEIEDKLGYSFKDRGWLERALTHRSLYGGTHNNDYERLEYLGDAVFDLAVAHLLLEKHPDAREGSLSKMRAALVNASSLAAVGRDLSLGKFIKFSRGELVNGAQERPSILADVVEAILGAVYREAGFEVARACVEKLLGDNVETVNPRDPKTELQEAMHASGNTAPTYQLECIEGPEHSPIFISTVQINGIVVGRGRGTTKKSSQQAAAEEALGKISANKDDKPILSLVMTIENPIKKNTQAESESQFDKTPSEAYHE